MEIYLKRLREIPFSKEYCQFYHGYAIQCDFFHDVDWYFSSIIFLFLRHKTRRFNLTILVLTCITKLSMVLDQATREHCTALLMLNLLFVDNITLFSKAKTEIVKISYLIQYFCKYFFLFRIYFCKYFSRVVSPNESKTLFSPKQQQAY